MQDISSRMDAVCRRFEELSMRLNQPDTAADPALFRKLMREYHDTEPVVEAYRDWQTALDHLAQAKALLEEPGSLDPDFKQMIQQEYILITPLSIGVSMNTAGNQRKKSRCGKAGK